MAVATVRGRAFFYAEQGEGVPILLIHPAGATAATWGAVADDLAHVGRVITYDRRGYGRTGGAPVHAIPQHTADAAALLDTLRARPTVVAGTSIGATIAIDLARQRPDLVRTVIAHESPWRARRQRNAAALMILAQTWWLAWRGRHADAATLFLRWAYTYREGGSAWDAFPEAWRQAARENARASLADIRSAIGDYPSPQALARITTPVVCTYGARSSDGMVRLTRALTAAIPTARMRAIDGAGHAAPFDAPAAFVQVVVEAARS